MQMNLLKWLFAQKNHSMSRFTIQGEQKDFHIVAGTVGCFSRLPEA
jgi:hypothetical protein